MPTSDGYDVGLSVGVLGIGGAQNASHFHVGALVGNLVGRFVVGRLVGDLVVGGRFVVGA